MPTKNTLVRYYWVTQHLEDCHSGGGANAVVKIPVLACISMLIRACKELNQLLSRNILIIVFNY